MFVKIERKNSESSHVPLQPHDIKSITESGAIGSSVVSEEYWITLLLYHEFLTIGSFTGSNKLYLFWLKVIVITVKRVSEFEMVTDSLFCIRECNRYCLNWLKVLALLLTFSVVPT